MADKVSTPVPPEKDQLVAWTKKDQKSVGFWLAFRPMAMLSVIGGISPYPWSTAAEDRKWLRRWPSLVQLLCLVTYSTVFVCHQPYPWLVLMATSATERVAFGAMWGSLYGGPWIAFILLQPKITQIYKVLNLFAQLGMTAETHQKMLRCSWFLVVLCLLLPVVIQGDMMEWFVSAGVMFQPIEFFYVVFTCHCVFLLHLVPMKVVFMAMLIRNLLKEVNRDISKTCTTLTLAFGSHRRSLDKQQKRTGASFLLYDQELRRHIVDFHRPGRLYFKLCDVVNTMGDTFGFTIICIYYIYVIMITGTLFYLGLALNSPTRMSNLVFSILVATIYVIEIAGFTSILGGIPREATKALKDLIRVRPLDLSPDCQAQVQALIQKMSGPPVQITAANFFAINRGLLTSIAGAVTTYLIVLAQFKGAEKPSPDGVNVTTTTQASSS